MQLRIMDRNRTRGSKEVEAESVAYTVCQHYGIDTSDYSFSYVAGWSEGKEMPELKASLDTIRRAASEMITAIDEKVEELVAQKTQEQIAAVPESAKPDTVDRKEELAELLKATVEKVSADTKKNGVSQENRSARSTKDEWCGLRHIGTHSSFRNHQWFSFPFTVEYFESTGGF